MNKNTVELSNMQAEEIRECVPDQVEEKAQFTDFWGRQAYQKMGNDTC
jgi:cephalosporin-C deacetylase-like acetyl esterase